MATSFINPDSTVDTIRKFFLVIVGSLLAIVYLISLIKLFKVNNKKFLHIETIAVFSCIIKILMLLIEEFIVNDEIFEFITVTFQTAILGFILYKFVKTVVENTPKLSNNIKAEVMGLRIFYFLIAAILLTNMILGVLNDNYFNCRRMVYSYNWYITLGINTLL